MQEQQDKIKANFSGQKHRVSCKCLSQCKPVTQTTADLLHKTDQPALVTQASFRALLIVASNQT